MSQYGGCSNHGNVVMTGVSQCWFQLYCTVFDMFYDVIVRVYNRVDHENIPRNLFYW